MSVQKKLASLIVVFALFAVLLIAPVAQAQEMTEEMAAPTVCDSTLVTLLLVAENDYDYLSNMMMDGGHTPNVELGQFKPLIDDIMSMMTMMHGQMTDQEMQMMATQEAQANDMMSMSDQALMKMWMESMNMQESDMPMNAVLTQGDVTGEDPACSALRKDVQHFLLVHIVASTMHSGM